MPLNLVLIGFMATGKSSVGRRCAQALSFRFRDSDTLVERRAGKSIPTIFAEEGEAAFRAMEAEAVCDLARARDVVISTGGGAVLNPENVEHLRRTGVVVLLTATPEAILERAARRSNRPLLAGAADPLERIKSLLRDRQPAYHDAAHAVVDTTGRTHDEVVTAVLAVYRDRAARRQEPEET